MISVYSMTLMISFLKTLPKFMTTVLCTQLPFHHFYFIYNCISIIKEYTCVDSCKVISVTLMLPFPEVVPVFVTVATLHSYFVSFVCLLLCSFRQQIISTFSVDSYRVYLVTLMISFLLAVPVFITIATVYCYFLIKEWCFVPIGTFVVCYVLQVSNLFIFSA